MRIICQQEDDFLSIQQETTQSVTYVDEFNMRKDPEGEILNINENVSLNRKVERNQVKGKWREFT